MKYLFVVTYGRSGSTALANLLNAIDGYCIRGENLGVIGHLSAAAKAAQDALAQHGQDQPGVEHPWYGAGRIDPAGFEQALVTALIEKVLIPPENTRVAGFKEIRYDPDRMTDEAFDNTIAFLLTAFGDARIIFNTRDWRQVARSGMWARRPARKVRKIVETCNERFRRAHARYPDRTFVIDHSQFDGNPDGFAPLLDWLGEAPDWDRVRQVSERRLVHLAISRRPGMLRRIWNRIAG